MFICKKYESYLQVIRELFTGDTFFDQELLEFVLDHIEDKNVEALLEVCQILT